MLTVLAALVALVILADAVPCRTFSKSCSDCCTSCFEGYRLVCQEPDGESPTCHCSASNCLVMDSSSQCLLCNDGYALSELSGCVVPEVSEVFARAASGVSTTAPATTTTSKATTTSTCPILTGDPYCGTCPNAPKCKTCTLARKVTPKKVKVFGDKKKVWCHTYTFTTLSLSANFDNDVDYFKYSIEPGYFSNNVFTVAEVDISNLESSWSELPFASNTSLIKTGAKQEGVTPKKGCSQTVKCNKDSSFSIDEDLETYSKKVGTFVKIPNLTHARVTLYVYAASKILVKSQRTTPSKAASLLSGENSYSEIVDIGTYLDISHAFNDGKKVTIKP